MSVKVLTDLHGGSSKRLVIQFVQRVIESIPKLIIVPRSPFVYCNRLGSLWCTDQVLTGRDVEKDIHLAAAGPVPSLELVESCVEPKERHFWR